MFYVGPNYGIGGHIRLHVRLKVSCSIFHCTIFHVILFSFSIISNKHSQHLKKLCLYGMHLLGLNMISRLGILFALIDLIKYIGH
jgi:hypothetical protein